MTLTASEVASLTTRIDVWEYAEYVCTALVAVACFGEYIADFTEWWKRDKFWKWFGSLEHRKDSVAKFSTLVLIGALAGELLCVVVTNQLSGKLVGALGDRAEEAYSKSGDALNNANAAVLKASSAAQQSSTAAGESANATTAASSALTIAHGARQEADSFEKDIKDAKRDASEAKALLSEVRRLAKEAQDHAASAEKGTAQLTTRFADRTLTDAQIKEIVDAIRPFAGQEFDVTPYWDLPESLAIANRIADALIAAGWKYVPPKTTGFMLGGISGVQVWTHPTTEDKVRRAADSLLKVLNREGVISVARTQNPANLSESKIHLNVGTKQ